MISLWQRWRALGTTQARLGLAGLLPVRPTTGPAFGAIAAPGGGLTALLALEGRRLWLEESAAQTEALRRIAGALSGPSVQILLRRRRADLAGSLAGWQTLARAGVADPARQAPLERDYVGLALPRLRDGGLARVSAALAVSAPDPTRLGLRVGRLLGLLPGEARALDLDEVAEWLRDWCGGEDSPRLASLREPAGPDSLAPASLVFADDHLRLSGDRAVRLWRATGLPPLVELGWARHLLAEPALAGLEWDLALHCRPVDDEAEERRATASALRGVEARLAGQPSGGRLARRADMRALVGARDELTRRLAALDGPGHQLRAASLWLAVRGDAADEELGEPLAAAFGRLGFALQPARGRLAVERAWRAVGPLDQAPAEPDETTTFLLPAAEIAPLAWLAVAPGQPPAGWPVLTTTAERVAGIGPAAIESDEHLIATGDEADEARSALQAWALALAWGGASVVALHAGGAWSRLAEATGGAARSVGPAGECGLDPIAGRGYRLDDRADWLAWLDEGAAFLARLLPELDAAGHDDLRAALVALGLAWLEHGRPLGLRSLLDNLEISGYDAAGGALAAALAGRWRWLVGPDPALAGALGLTAIGWAGADDAEWPLAATMLLRRLLREQLACPAARRRPTVLVVDDGAALLADPAAAATLVEIAQRGRTARLRLWLAAGPSAGLARSLAGRLLLVNAGGRAAFREAAATPHDLIDGMGWPEAVARLIPALPPGAAVLRAGGQTAVGQVASGEVLAQARARGTPGRWRAPVMAAG
jgi:hypothetical protein